MSEDDLFLRGYIIDAIVDFNSRSLYVVIDTPDLGKILSVEDVSADKSYNGNSHYCYTIHKILSLSFNIFQSLWSRKPVIQDFQGKVREKSSILICAPKR